MIRTALVVSTALALSACVSLAPYGPARTPTGQGYVEQRIETTRWRVTYRGVGARSEVADRAFRRAAELTIAQGFDWFEVTQSVSGGRSDADGGLQPSVSIGAGTGRYGGLSTSGVGVGIGLNFSGPHPTSTTIEIVLGRGTRPERATTYAAREVLAAPGR
ncbi:hypothetical protein GVN24_24320 [Rhizobium sp. CRIBSB]|nr:hypothetical protein [Rhizobium sp. CRIBSB]